MTTDQPTPPSSLEEARKRLYWKIQDARSHMAMVREADEAFAEYDAFIKAAVRAEVIREVEAALMEQFGIGHTEDHMLCEGVESDPTHCGLCRVVVSALSQGGEGKSDG